MTQQETRETLRRPYEPPKAVYVPLKLEERLITCIKVYNPQGTCFGGDAGS